MSCICCWGVVTDDPRDAGETCREVKIDRLHRADRAEEPILRRFRYRIQSQGNVSRAVKLLKEFLRALQTNERYIYYLAQSYREIGKPEKAIKWYRRRVKFGGWDEETWHAQYCVALLHQQIGDEAGFIREMLIAYNMRPSRAETIYRLAKFWRTKGMNALAVMAAEAGMAIPRPDDAMFVEDYPYAIGCKEEFAICGFYVPHKRQAAFKVTNELALTASPYAQSRELARNNLYWYMPHFGELAPSWRSKAIAPFTPDTGWSPTNPSVTLADGELRAIIRTVNYRIDEEGRFWIGNSRPDDEHPIVTRNFLTTLDNDLNVTISDEVLPPKDMPKPLFPQLIGFEDMRLFQWKGQLWTCSVVCEMTADGLPEQVLARIDGNRLADMKRMRHHPRGYEKNWMPFVQGGDHLEFMYRLGQTVDTDGNFQRQIDTGLETQHISGGSQIIAFDDGWLCLVHEARLIPGQTIRFYMHRFAYFNNRLELKRLTRPFCFDDKVIEFGAGLCWHPDRERIVISYGVRDREAKIGILHHSDLRDALSES